MVDCSYADHISIGDELLVLKNDNLIPSIVIDVFGKKMEGKSILTLIILILMFQNWTIFGKKQIGIVSKENTSFLLLFCI